MKGLIIVGRKIRQLRRVFKFLVYSVLAVFIFSMVNGCGGEKKADTPPGYSSPQLVTVGIVNLSNDVLLNGKKALTDEDARELTRLCAGGGIEGQMTNLLFNAIDKLGDDVTVEFTDQGTAVINENLAEGVVGMSITYHGGKIVGNKTLNSNVCLKIEKDKKFSGILSWFNDERSDFWVITEIKAG